MPFGQLTGAQYPLLTGAANNTLMVQSHFG